MGWIEIVVNGPPKNNRSTDEDDGRSLLPVEGK